MAKAQKGRIRKTPVFREPPLELKHKFRFVFFLLLFFVLAGSAYWFVRSDYFSVQALIVEGNDRLSDNEIVLQTGVCEGQNIWDVDVSRLEGNLEESHLIKEVFVQKYLPDTIVFRITEYLPLALAAGEGRFIEINENGAVMGLPTSIAGKGLPIITGLSFKDVSRGELVEGKGTNLALSWAAAIRKEERVNLTEIRLNEDQQAVLVTDDGFEILMGPQEDLLQVKLDIVIPIIEDLRESDIQALFVDMRVPEKPVVIKQDG